MEQEDSSVPTDTLRALQDLSVLVITCPFKCHSEQFRPSPLSPKKIDWFEGTGSVIGAKRNSAFIISSIHCNPDRKYSYFIKGVATKQVQIKATLCSNQYEESDNGIDIAIFSCDIRLLDRDYLRQLDNLHWYKPDVFPTNEDVWLVHFPTNLDASTPEAVTYRLYNPVFPTITHGTTISEDISRGTFDSSIIATGGSSGGLVVDSAGRILGTHDSQHDETTDHTIVSTHRFAIEVVSHLRHIRQLQGIFKGLET